MADHSEKRPSRIRQRNTERIFEAALDTFSTHGYRGSTLDQIATAAGLSKPNLLYYFEGKEAIHKALLERLLDTWLAPLRAIDPDGDPVEEILAYVRRKLEMARHFPRESRLYANEMVQGAPRIIGFIKGDLKDLVDDRALVFADWAARGRIRDVDPYHLIFSVWSLTQHYADFDVQISAILGPSDKDRFANAEKFLEDLFRRMLEP